MDEAAHLADRIAVIAGGRIIAEGPPATIGGRATAASTISFTLADVTTLPGDLRERATIAPTGRVALTSRDPLQDIAAIARFARETGAEPADLDVHRPSLEDVYLTLTQNGTDHR